MNHENRPRTVEEILAHAEELADFFEANYYSELVDCFETNYYSPWFDEFWRLSPERLYRIITGRGRR